MINPDTKVSLLKLVALARDLVSEDGENPEYDRGITELVADAAGLSPTDDKEAVAREIGVKPAAIAKWKALPGA